LAFVDSWRICQYGTSVDRVFLASEVFRTRIDGRIGQRLISDCNSILMKRIRLFRSSLERLFRMPVVYECAGNGCSSAKLKTAVQQICGSVQSADLQCGPD